MMCDQTGRTLDVGRKTRSIPTAIRRALAHRDDGGRFPGCTNTIVDGHHIEQWIDGGETKLANLVSLCRRHHRFVHEGGAAIESHDNGEIRFVRADGTSIVRGPEPLAAAPLPTECCRAPTLSHPSPTARPPSGSAGGLGFRTHQQKKRDSLGRLPLIARRSLGRSWHACFVPKSKPQPVNRAARARPEKRSYAFGRLGEPRSRQTLWCSPSTTASFCLWSK